MESKIKSYEEQVLELGNGKMLKPGCYNEKMKKLCDISDIKTLGIKNPGHRYYDDILYKRDRVNDKEYFECRIGSQRMYRHCSWKTGILIRMYSRLVLLLCIWVTHI